MAAGLLLSLCAAAALLHSTHSRSPYTDLPKVYRKGVDLALEQLNSHVNVQHHFLFLRSLKKTETEGNFGVQYYNHHFYLKPTRCPKGASEDQHCPFRDDRPLMDCQVCYKTIAGEIDSSSHVYVHCIHKPRLTQEMRNTRVNECKKVSYNPGAATILASSSG